MNKLKVRKNGITLLMLILMTGNLTLNGGATARLATNGADSDVALVDDAHISELTLGKDNAMHQPTDEFGVNDTIYAAVKIAENRGTVTVKGRLHVVEIAGQKPGPIAALDVNVTIKGENTADFQFSKPTKGWPVGTYKFEALVINAKGEEIDSDSHEFSVN